MGNERMLLLMHRLYRAIITATFNIFIKKVFHDKPVYAVYTSMSTPEPKIESSIFVKSV